VVERVVVRRLGVRQCDRHGGRGGWGWNRCRCWRESMPAVASEVRSVEGWG
jgi:hypothetical protein